MASVKSETYCSDSRCKEEVAAEYYVEFVETVLYP